MILSKSCNEKGTATKKSRHLILLKDKMPALPQARDYWQNNSPIILL